MQRENLKFDLNNQLGDAKKLNNEPLVSQICIKSHLFLLRAMSLEEF